jgi:hypothetical protein
MSAFVHDRNRSGETLPRKSRIPRSVVRAAANARACAQPGDELVRVYLIEERRQPYAPGSIRRAGGAPIGVDERTRPRYNGEFMHHLVTIDLDEVPEVRAICAFAHARAVAVFISHAMDNCAWNHDNQETAVVALTEGDLALGEWNGPEVADPEPRSFDLHPVDVPTRAFYDATGPDFDELGIDPALEDLHDELASGNRVGGPAMPWPGDTRSREFIMQFGEEVVDVNLGDAGMMFVFADTAYSRGH